MDAKTRIIRYDSFLLLSNVSFTVSSEKLELKTNFRKLMIFSLLINGLLDRY